MVLKVWQGWKKVVAIRLMDSMKYCTPSNMTVLEYAIKKIGEKNASLDFLDDDSRDTVLKPRKNGCKKKMCHHST